MPNIELSSIQGKSFNVSKDFNDPDKLYVFSFWATWCAPCVNELEAFHQNYENWKKELDIVYVFKLK